MQEANKKILITGSSGTIGTELCDQLRELGHSVTGIDKVNFQKPNLDSFYQHDLTTYPESIMGDFDILIHLAANARVHNSVVNPELAKENMLTTHYAYELARRLKIPKLIMASSRETYGEDVIMEGEMPLPTDESHASQRNSLSPYTAGKIMGEAYSYAYDNCYDIESKIIRFSNVYGRYDSSDRYIPKIIKKMLKDEAFEVWGENKVLDFTYITDAVEGVIAVIDNWDRLPKEINIADGQGSNLLKVAYDIKHRLDSNTEITVTPSLTGEVTSYIANIDVMKSIGWSPKITLDEGLSLSIDYYKELYK
jgi:nucleoside-diphosphate-sugar epimerase